MLLKADATKVCPKCKKEKSVKDFPKKHYQCKVCHQAYQTSEKKKEYSSKWYFKRKQNRPENYLFKQAKHRAKDSNLEFSISEEDIKIPDYCPYLGVKLEVRSKHNAPSLDRIDNTKGYIKDNIQVISYQANLMKNSASIDDLLRFAKGIMRLHERRQRDVVES